MARRGGFPGGGMPATWKSHEAGAEDAAPDGGSPEGTGGEGSDSRSRGGAVEVTVSGKKEITKVKLSEEVVDPDDIEMLEDLIMAATNEALRQMERWRSPPWQRLPEDWEEDFPFKGGISWNTTANRSAV